MKKLTTILFIVLFYHCSAQINVSYNITEKIKLHKIILNESFVEERAYFISNSIMKNADVVFCFTDYKTKTAYIYMDEVKDGRGVVSSLNSMGYTVNSKELMQSSNDIFLYLYYQYYSKETQLLNEADMVPPKLKTGNASRDYTLYLNARKFWGMKYPERLMNLSVADENEAKLILPSDFPIWQGTGNDKADELDYDQKKQIWIKKHPQIFEKIKHLNWDKLSNKPDNN